MKLVDSERPAWREALLLGSNSGWLQLLIRTNSAKEMPEGMTKIEHKGKTFCLLGCPPSKFVAFCEKQSLLKLELSAEELLEKGQDALASETEMVFLSAGESAKAEKRRPARKSLSRPQPQDSSSEEESSQSSSSRDSDLQLTLGNLKKKWQDSGTRGEGRNKEKQHSRGGRHSLLQIKDKGDSGENQSRQMMLKTMASEQDPLKAWVTLQVYKDLQKDQRRKHGRRRQHSDDDSTSDSAVSSSGREERKKKSGAARAVEGFEASKRRMKRHPLRYVKRYVRDLEKELGAQGRPFRIHEGSRRVPWGKQKTLQRCHFMFSEVLELMLKEKWERAALQVVLCLKSLHQTAVDGGDWSVGWLLCHLNDPLNKAKFGGSVEELGHVTSYLKSMAELQRNTEKLRNSSYAGNAASSTPENTETSYRKDTKKGKGKGKNKKSDETKDSKEGESQN